METDAGHGIAGETEEGEAEGENSRGDVQHAGNTKGNIPTISREIVKPKIRNEKLECSTRPMRVPHFGF